MRKNKISLDYYQQIFDLYEEGYSFKSIIIKLNLDIHVTTLRLNYNRYKLHGLAAIQAKPRNASYSHEFKQQVVREYLDEGLSLRDITVKYNIPATRTVQCWIKKYTEGNENKTYSPSPEVYRMKKKKLSYDEKLEAVNYCINRDKDYKRTAEHYQVNYAQIYSWVKKFEEHGATGLIDSRGKVKPIEIRSTEDELRLKIKALEDRNNYLKMENEILKKQEQNERQLMEQESDSQHHIKRLKN